MRTLREFKEAIRFIYVCSNHKLPLKNLLDFSSLTGFITDPDPIIPVRIIPIDMTPHTLRSELVILCERFDLSLLNYRVRNNVEMNCNNGSNRLDSIRTAKSCFRSCSPNRIAVSASTACKYTNFSNTLPHSNRLTAAGVTSSLQSSYTNRFSYPASFPPKVTPKYNGTNSFENTSSANDFYTEDRYSSFRRDFEKAIDSSYSAFDSSNNTNEFLPLDVVRKIEERAFREGLTRGIQQCAYQVGYQLGLRSSSEKLFSYDELLGLSNNGGVHINKNNTDTNKSLNVNSWDYNQFDSSIVNESKLISTPESLPSSSTIWNQPSVSVSSNNEFQTCNRSINLNSFTNNNTNNNITDFSSNQNSLWK